MPGLFFDGRKAARFEVEGGRRPRSTFINPALPFFRQPDCSTQQDETRCEAGKIGGLPEE